MQAYNKLDQPEKVLDYGERLISKGFPATFTSPEGGLVVLNVLFLVVRSTSSLPAATEAQLALGKKAARDLLEFVSRFHPANTPEADWTAARTDLERRTQAAILAMALAPGNQAMAKDPPDCAAASAAWSAAAGEHPHASLIAYNLGKALQCEGRTA